MAAIKADIVDEDSLTLNTDTDDTILLSDDVSVSSGDTATNSPTSGTGTPYSAPEVVVAEAEDYSEYYDEILVALDNQYNATVVGDVVTSMLLGLIIGCLVIKGFFSRR